MTESRERETLQLLTLTNNTHAINASVFSEVNRSEHCNQKCEE